VRRKMPELWPIDWNIHRDNATAHKTLCVKQFLAQKSNIEMEHPSYSPDLAPNDIWLFPKIKSFLKGRRFRDTEKIQKMWLHYWKNLFHNSWSRNSPPFMKPLLPSSRACHWSLPLARWIQWTRSLPFF
jgi:hypothetical protein